MALAFRHQHQRDGRHQRPTTKRYHAVSQFALQPQGPNPLDARKKTAQRHECAGQCRVEHRGHYVARGIAPRAIVVAKPTS